MKLNQWCVVGTVLCGLATAPGARAATTSTLSEVEKAYAEVDYERTHTLAVAAIQRGGNDRAATSQLYFLWATAAAALGDADDARQAFLYALAANPELKLDRSLSPKIRAPYLEARGSMSGADGRPPLEVVLRRHRQMLELVLQDVLHVAASVVVLTRDADGAVYVKRRFDAVPTRQIPQASGADLQFAVRVLDRYDNVLFELGTEDNPERLVSVVGTAPRAGAAGRERSPLGYYVTSGVLGALGLASGGAALAMYLRREDAAREWNGSSCEQTGLSRAEQCGGVDDRRKRAEQWAIGFTAAGGALLVGSVVSLVLAPSPARAEVALETGPDKLMLRLRGAL